MDKSSITTMIIIASLAIIGLYAAGEVNYYSAKTIMENDLESPVLSIPTIGMHEKINNISISHGVYHEKQSFTPTNGEVVLYGHRTLQGSPFLRLNELDSGDSIILNWPEIGEVSYKVTDKRIVSGNTQLNYSNNDNKIMLITCDPIGSTANRLIVEGDLSSLNELDKEILKENPQKYHSILIIILFIIFGLVLCHLCRKENRIYLIMTVVIITIILTYFYFFPISSNIIYSRIIG